MEAKIPLRTLVLKRLLEAGRPLAAFEFGFMGISENNLCTRLSEYQREGLIVGEYRPHSAYKHWRLAKDGEVVKPARKPRPISIPVVGVKETLCQGMQILTVSVPQSLSGKKFSYHVEAREA